MNERGFKMREEGYLNDLFVSLLVKEDCSRPSFFDTQTQGEYEREKWSIIMLQKQFSEKI